MVGGEGDKKEREQKGRRVNVQDNYWVIAARLALMFEFPRHAFS